MQCTRNVYSSKLIYDFFSMFFKLFYCLKCFCSQKTIIFCFGSLFMSLPMLFSMKIMNSHAVVRECISNTDQSELSEENDNADKGIQNSHEVAYCLYNLYISYNCLSTNFVALLNLSLRSLIQCSLGKGEEMQEL